MAYRFSEAELAAAPRVTLGGLSFALPAMAPRQMRVILPALAAMPDSRVARLSAANFDSLVDILHAALSRARPEITREEIEDLPIAVEEYGPALAAIAAACGMRPAPAAGLAEAGHTGAAPGKDEGEAPSPISTT